MATVYLAHDVRHDRRIALKVMHPEVAFALGRERFLREIRVAARLSHPHIVGVHDSGDINGVLFYVMPCVEGESLRDRLNRDGKLEIPDAIHIAQEIADALGYAHASGVVHRDVKPENILLSGGHAMIADFGIASAVEASRDNRITATGVSLGTPAYMSPEQALSETVDARADVWALGSVIYEMVAGATPFGNDMRRVLSRSLTGSPMPLREARADAPIDLERIVARSLQREPAERFASGKELAQALHEVDLSVRPAAPKRPSRRRQTTVIGATLVSLIVIATLGALWNRSRASRTNSATRSSAAAAATLSHDSVARQLYARGQAQVARRTQAAIAEAISLFSQAISRDSTFALAWAGLARTSEYAAQRGLTIPGKTRESLLAQAIPASERAVELDSSNAEIWLVRGTVSFAVDPTDRVVPVAAIERALAIDSTYARAWNQLALRRQELLEDDAAKRAWLRAITLDPKQVEALAFFALHHWWTGQYQAGVQWADSAIALDPTYVLAREAAGSLALDLNRLTDAERNYQAYLRITSGREQVNGLCGMARVAVAEGDLAAARNYVARATSLADSANPTTHEAVLIGEALAAVGDTARAIRWIAAYQPRGNLHFQLHLKRDPPLRWLRARASRLLTPDPR